ncbi:MAG: hypothetical protein IKO68_08300 [Oscillospiraceae bacterium]|nr:hypothetical protein [Oscillospiraceae bacterium]
MVSYDEALAIAKKLKKNVDACDEYADAYVFKNRDEEYMIGGSGPVVVLKENGRAINQVEYFSRERTHIREFNI